MKNIGVLNTLRLYEADFIEKLELLMQQEGYTNKTEFLTMLLKEGYDSHTAVRYETGSIPLPDSSTAVTEKLDGLHTQLSELNDYVVLQFKVLSLYQEVYQRMLSAIYRMQFSQAGGEKVATASVEAGYFDDLPVRFEKTVQTLKEQFGLS